MKFVEGTSLAKHPRGDPRRRSRAWSSVVRAVHHAHQRGVLHRDLKPSNVLVDPQGTRLRHRLRPGQAADRRGPLADRDRARCWARPRYMAPEQAAGRKDLTVAADVYSLGVILYERLTGQTPFTGENALDPAAPGPRVRAPAPVVDPPGPRPRPGDGGAQVPGEGARPPLPLGRGPGRRPGPLAPRPSRSLARPVGQAERFWRWCKRNPGGQRADGGRGCIALGRHRRLDILRRAGLATTHSPKSPRASVHSTAENNMEGLLARGLAKPLDPDGDGKETSQSPKLNPSGSWPDSATRTSASASWTRRRGIRSL